MSIPQQFYQREAEEAVLGSIMIDPASIYRVMALLSPEDFYHQPNALIYAAMVSMAERGVDIDVVTLMGELATRGTLKDVGGSGEIARLAGFVPSSLHVEHYARQVRDAAIRRALARAAQRIAQMATAEETGLVAAAKAEGLIAALGEDRREGQLFTIGEVLGETVDRLEFAQNGGNTGIKYGFADLDRVTGGMHEGEFIIIAGRPGMGKTAFGLQVAANVAARGTGVLFFSLEMPRYALAQRMIAATGRVTLTNLRMARLGERDWQAVMEIAGQMASWPLHIEDTPGLDIMVIRSLARMAVQRHNVRVVVVDYTQLVKARQGVRWENRFQEVAAVARGLKNLAHGLGITVIGLTQLNRAVDNRADKRPVLSDLRESGELEQAADVVMALYREAAYHPDRADDGEAELSIIKNRQGPLATIPLYYDAKYTAFRDAVKDKTFLES